MRIRTIRNRTPPDAYRMMTFCLSLNFFSMTEETEFSFDFYWKVINMKANTNYESIM